MIITCLYCKKEFKDYESNKRKYCSQQCKNSHQSIRNIGKNHWNWKGGITPEYIRKKNSKEWKKIRETVYLRDKEICKKCGRKCNRLNRDLGKIQCDHIISRKDGGLDEMNNLQTLCLKCHMDKDWHKSVFNYKAKKCVICEKEFIKKRGPKSWKEVKYCSRNCFKIWMKTSEAKSYYSTLAKTNKFFEKSKTFKNKFS